MSFPRKLLSLLLVLLLLPAAALATTPDEVENVTTEIGRASCRERV